MDAPRNTTQWANYWKRGWGQCYVVGMTDFSREALPQDLEAYGREARAMTQDAFAQKRPTPFLLFARTSLWDRTLLLNPGGGDGDETRVAHYDMNQGGRTFVSPIKKRVTTNDEAIILGRIPGNDLMVPVASISSRHAAFNAPKTPNGPWTITDLGSTNGTFLVEQRLPAHTPTALPDGEYLRLGGNLIAWFMSPKALWQAFADPAKLAQLIEL